MDDGHRSAWCRAYLQELQMPHASRPDQPSTIRFLGTWAPAPLPPEAPSSPHGRTSEQWLRGSFAQGARRINYRLFVPASCPDTAFMPMVVILHGCGQDAQSFARGTRMNELAREAGVMVLYPEQVQRANAQNCWNCFKPLHQRRGRGEPELLACLVRGLANEYGADPSRIYVAGLPAGGAMAAILAQEYPEIFAAVGVHSGVPPGVVRDLDAALDAMLHGVAATRTPVARGPIPLIVFHGEADGVVHRSNGSVLVDAACQALGLSLEPDLRTGRSVNCRSFTQRAFRLPDGVSMVEHWQLHCAGHAWSGGDAAGCYCSPGGPDASAEMLRFFLTHRTPMGSGLLN